MVDLKDWQEINIGNDTTLKARIGWQGLTTSEYKDSGEYYLVTGTDFENGFVNWDTCHFVDEWRFDQDKNIQLKVNDVLITKDGTIGKAGFIDTIKLPTTLNSGVFVIRTNSNKLDQKYLYYIFTSEIFVEFLNRLTAGSTINHLYQKDFVHFTFKAPNIEEQKAIAKALSDTDKLITSLEKLISKKEAIKQGTMQQLLTGKKRLSGFRGEWEIKKIQNIFDFKQGIQCPIENQYKDKKVNFVRFIRIVDLTRDDEPIRYINNPGENYNVSVNDLFMVRYGNPGLVGYGYTGVIANNLFRLIPKIKLYSKFYYYLLVFKNDEILELSSSTTMSALNFTSLYNLELYVPEIKEQESIAQILSDMDNEIESLKSKLSKTKAIKDGIMSELLTGKVKLN